MAFSKLYHILCAIDMNIASDPVSCWGDVLDNKKSEKALILTVFWISQRSGGLLTCTYLGTKMF